MLDPPPKPVEVSIKVEEDDEGEEAEAGTQSIFIEDDEDDIDPKDVWRVAFPFNEYQLFLRPATFSMFFNSTIHASCTILFGEILDEGK